MTEFEAEINSATTALTNLAEGPGAAAAESLERAFGRAGNAIERTLSQAAKSGELDFQKMSEAILRDLARIAAESVFANGGNNSPAGQIVNMNMKFGAGANRGDVMSSRGAIASALAGAARIGGRYI